MSKILARVWAALILGLIAPITMAQQELTFPSAAGTDSIPASLFKPDGQGPFPALVIMHDCNGLGPRSSGAARRWGRELLQQGYVILIPDSFSPRGASDGVCTLSDPTIRAATSGDVRAADAYGALAALRELPFVDGRRVGIMGSSHGGWTTLAAMVTASSDTDPLALAKRAGFAAGIAFYPSCLVRLGEWSVLLRNGRTGPMSSHRGVYKPIAPTLILSGELDDWPPAEPCRQLVEVARAEGHPIDIHIYPGAYHAFDNDAPVRFVAQRNNPSTPGGFGATTGGNPAAWADARKRVAAFFATHLKQ